jgi:hypothetical protein
MAISTIGQNGLNAPLSLTSPTIATPTFTGQATIPTINLTGGQITFPATQSASSDANTLDDYEEGTFTPVLSATGYTFSQPVQQGSYTKIGNCVTFKIYMVTSVSTGSGGAQGLITGLPFSASATNPNYGGCSFFPDSGSSFWSRVGVIRTNNGTANLYIGNGWNGSGLSASLNWATLPSSTEWEISGHYYV